MKKKSLVTLALSLSAVAVVGLGSTLAYFNQDTNTVTNTFTVGQGYKAGELTLDEAKAKQDGINWVVDNEADPARVEENTYSGLMPNSHIAKDPTVNLATTVNSYVYVKVDGVDEAYAAGLKISLPVADTINTNWKLVQPDGTYDGIYAYVGSEGSENAIVTTSIVNSALFTEMYVDPAVDTQEELNMLQDKRINIQAAAIQADGITSDEALEIASSTLDLEDNTTLTTPAEN